jgi:hypothetical protein
VPEEEGLVNAQGYLQDGKGRVDGTREALRQF